MKQGSKVVLKHQNPRFTNVSNVGTVTSVSDKTQTARVRWPDGRQYEYNFSQLQNVMTPRTPAA